MDEQVEDENPFAISALWKASAFAHFDENATDPIPLGFEPLNVQDEDYGQLEILKDQTLKLTDSSTFTYGPIEDLGALDTSSVLSSADSFEILEPLDIWSFPVELEEQKIFRSWETFYDKTFHQPRTTYISESGPQVSDAILAAQDEFPEDDEVDKNNSGCVIKPVALLPSLLSLGVGRDSVLYRYEEHERSFLPLQKNMRMSGYSLEAFESLSATVIDHGNKIKRLQSFIDVTQTSSKSFPSSVALAGSITSILVRLQAQLGVFSKSTCSLLQIQSLFERPGLIISYLNDLVIKVEGASTEAELLSQLYEHVQASEHSAIRPALFQILASVSRPWLESVSEWIGLRAGITAGVYGHSPNFVIAIEEMQRLEVGKETKKLEYNFEHSAVPNFVLEEDSLIIFETGKALRLLESYRPEHPLSKLTQNGAVAAPDLDWQFCWQDVERNQSRSQEYQSKLEEAIVEFNLDGSNAEKAHLHKQGAMQTQIATAGLSEETAKAYIHASIAAFEKPLPDLTVDRDNDSHQEEIFPPPLSLLPVLSFNPLIGIQAVLINRACLRLIFKEHNLRSHLSLLHRYSLFGDGVFACRLSHAIFDPELDSAKGRTSWFRAGTPGLKNDSRDNWPPASSELRLALVGVLTESYYESGRAEEGSSMFREELPGGLSFGIRDMSEDELQRCMDPNSIEALDFLRLQYRPPAPLDTVITPASLAKYDTVFKVLLRAARMLFVVNQLFRDTNPRFALQHGADPLKKSFQIESHYFVSAICRYFFNGVQANWHTLQQKLEDVDKALDSDGTSQYDSLHKLRDYHENLLDRLMFTLILRKRQTQVMKLLEEIFSLILVFARHVRTEATQDMASSDSKVDVKETYGKFKKKVKVFINVCRGLSERRGEGGTTIHVADEELSEDEGNTIGQLLLDFEMSGYYAR